MIVYKIVRNVDGKLYSYLNHGLNKDYVIEYIPHIETKPKFGKLFVFADIERARTVAFNGYHTELWRASTSNIEKIDRIISPLEARNPLKSFIKFWETGIIPNRLSFHAPIGTYVCDSLILHKNLT